MKVGFIGTGNMGGAIIKGYSPSAKDKGIEVLAYNRTRSKAEAIAAKFPVTLMDGIDALVSASDIVVLCVEPQNFDEVLPKVAKAYTNDKIFISIAAGITIEHIEGTLGASARIVRVMPNTPAMVGMGATAVCRNQNVDDESFKSAMDIFKAIGIAAEVEEEQIHAIIGVSGSSPAYTYLYIDALIQAGIEYGLDQDTARAFACQAVMGAAKLAAESGETPAQLADNVCSPGGTTIEAVKLLKERSFEQLVVDGAKATMERSKEMTR